MNTKVLLGALAATVVTFLGGWIVFGMLLADFFASGMDMTCKTMFKEPPDFAYLVAWQICWSLMLAYVLDKMGKRSFMDGLMTGGLISFLIVLGYDLSFMAFFNLYTTKLIVVDIVANTVLWSLAAGVAGLVLGTGKKA